MRSNLEKTILLKNMVCGEDMEGNLTKGPILKTLTKLAIPIMASSFLGTLYNLTDMAWIGLLGSKAVAGVGVGGMYTWLSQGLASMARMGGQVQVAQCIGKGNRDEANKYAQTAVQLATLMGLVYAAIVLLFLHRLIGFFHLDDAEAIAAALSYTRIACGLIVFSFLTFTLTGIYTAQGDSKTPFIANLIGLVINMILDPVLILGPGPLPELGVAGAAIATVTAQGIVMSVMVIGIFVQKKDNVLKGIRLFARIPMEYVSGICKIGIPTALQGMAYCVISMVLARMVSVFGAEAVAVQRVGGQIESLSWNTADGFAAALNAFVGQNYGANKMDRDQTLCAFKFFRHFYFCILITEVADSQKLFLILFSCVRKNLFILTIKRFKFTINNNVFFFTQSDQFLIVVENRIRIFKLLCCIDLLVVRIHFDPRLALCESSLFTVVPLHRSSRIVTASQHQTFHHVFRSHKT